MKKLHIMGNVDWYAKEFSEFESKLNGQATTDLHNIRKKAIKSFVDLGYPTTKNEEWKYTDVTSLAEHNFYYFQEPVANLVDSEDIKRFKFSDLDCYTLVFVNGQFVPGLSNNTAPSNVIMKSIGAAYNNNREIISEYLSHYARFDSDSFTALNTAFLQDGTLIYVPNDVVLDKPIHILYLSKTNEKHVLTQPRTIIVAGQNSQVKIIETHADLDNGIYFANVVDEVVLHSNATVEHFKLQLESKHAYHIATTQVHQERDSNYTSHLFSAGGSLVRNNLNSVLDASGAQCILNGLYIANDNQHVDTHTVIDHAKPHCNSHELYKGILNDRAGGVFNGKIYVRPDAQKTNAIQANNCLLLSDDATIDTKPQLEIYADDVKCTHGATVGQLDEEAFFYLRSRGIDKEVARNLLIYAFASDVIDRIEIDQVRERMANLLADKLHTIKPV